MIIIDAKKSHDLNENRLLSFFINRSWLCVFILLFYSARFEGLVHAPRTAWGRLIFSFCKVNIDIYIFNSNDEVNAKDNIKILIKGFETFETLFCKDR